MYIQIPVIKDDEQPARSSGLRSHRRTVPRRAPIERIAAHVNGIIRSLDGEPMAVLTGNCAEQIPPELKLITRRARWRQWRWYFGNLSYLTQ